MNVQYLARMIIGGSFLALYLFVALCHWGMLLDWLLTKRRVGSMVPLVGDIAGVIGALLMPGIPTWVAWALPFCDIGFLVFLATLPVLVRDFFWTKKVSVVMQGVGHMAEARGNDRMSDVWCCASFEALLRYEKERGFAIVPGTFMGMRKFFAIFQTVEAKTEMACRSLGRPVHCGLVDLGVEVKGFPTVVFHPLECCPRCGKRFDDLIASNIQRFDEMYSKLPQHLRGFDGYQSQRRC